MDPTRLPPELAAHVRAFADSGEPAEPRHASTVVLLGEGNGEPGGVQVYLLRRRAELAFAAGMCVFPGGAVDPRDFDADVGWVGPPAAEWAAVLDADEPFARALVCAACRETFEESGVLLAGPCQDTVVADTTGADWETDRRRLEAGDLAFSEFLRRRGLKLRTDLLRLWSRWVTPVFEPRRFDARFFVAELPAGQVTRDVSTESDRVLWTAVRDAIRSVDAGDLRMLPPTYFTCLELFELTSPAAALASCAARDVSPVEPVARIEGGVGYLDLPERLAVLGARVRDRIDRCGASR